jgi:hypothetical protein
VHRVQLGFARLKDIKKECAISFLREGVSKPTGIVDDAFRFEDVKATFGRLAQGPMGKVLIRVAG